MVIKYDVLQVLDEYIKSFGESWRSIQADSTEPWPYLNEALTKFQACKCLCIILALARIIVEFTLKKCIIFTIASNKFFLFDNLLRDDFSLKPFYVPVKSPGPCRG